MQDLSKSGILAYPFLLTRTIVDILIDPENFVDQISIFFVLMYFKPINILTKISNRS